MPTWLTPNCRSHAASPAKPLAVLENSACSLRERPFACAISTQATITA